MIKRIFAFLFCVEVGTIKVICSDCFWLVCSIINALIWYLNKPYFIYGLFGGAYIMACIFYLINDICDYICSRKTDTAE